MREIEAQLDLITEEMKKGLPLKALLRKHLSIMIWHYHSDTIRTGFRGAEEVI